MKQVSWDKAVVLVGLMQFTEPRGGGGDWGLWEWRIVSESALGSIGSYLNSKGMLDDLSI